MFFITYGAPLRVLEIGLGCAYKSLFRSFFFGGFTSLASYSFTWIDVVFSEMNTLSM
jgi:hypothetical protein